MFYDVETTGIDARHDQILQFAAIRTDADLSITERVELRCRLDRHVVPHPEALVLTGRSLDEIRAPGLASHYAMMRDVAALVEAWSPSTIIGYNSIGFDEEFLRHALWRTLHNPYLTSWSGNVRADALTLCRAVAFFSPGALTVPTDEQGHRRFGLEALSRANGVAAPTAHAAIDDAEATLALCRLVMERDEETWSRFLRFAAKPAAAALVDSRQPFCAVRFFGNEPRPVIAAIIGPSRTDANRRHCFDLSADLQPLSQASEKGLGAMLSAPGTPVFRLRVNACPALCEIWDLPLDARDGMAEEEWETRALRLADDPDLRSRMLAAIERDETPRQPSEYLEEQLYEALPSRTDDHLMRAFHDSSWQDRLDLLAGMEDPRTRRLARRLIHAEAPGMLPAAMRERYDMEIARRLRAPARAHPFRTVADAVATAREMGASCPPELLLGLAALG